MSLEKILSITGKPGLYELKTQTRSGFVVESLLDGKKMAVSLRHNVSLLSEIAVYTLSEELPLNDVFEKMHQKENGEKASVNPKDEKIKLEEYFFEVLPDYDEDRVYASDIKKIVQWYNLLIDKKLLKFEEEEKQKKEKKEKAKGKGEKKAATTKEKE
ncbi:DUF5606 domain-containing protein [Sungkyunkwania multivorans]|uniref:DUF5606 domain-containing protein n=1 Tax=Sungkyunkwania multivorans TaxID=1173618 RepID=A0ABW3CW58_9FLAO